MMPSINRLQKTYTAAATVEYEEFGFHATSLTGNLNVTVRMHRPVETSHSLRQQSCEPSPTSLYVDWHQSKD